jgi:Lon protease-like protein
MNDTSTKIALFPLQLVLFPGGLLPLKIFEKRYVDMVRSCLREKRKFGIVSVYEENNHSDYPFSTIGTLVEIIDTDVSQPGLFNIRCVGIQKFKIMSAYQENDVPLDLAPTKVYFEQLIDSLKREYVKIDEMPFISPYELDSCVWLSSRWCEILDFPLIEKQRMLALDDALLRLTLINDMLTANPNK